jgi:hypothetical protein
MRLRTRALSQLTALLLAGTVLTACGNDPGPLNGQLEGSWKRADGLVIEFDGNKAKVTDFGDSPLGTNRSIYDTGDEFMRVDACDTHSCGGAVAVPEYANGILRRVRMDGVHLEYVAHRLTVSSFGTGDSTEFTRVDSGTGG